MLAEVGNCAWLNDPLGVASNLADDQSLGSDVSLAFREFVESELKMLNLTNLPTDQDVPPPPISVCASLQGFGSVHKVFQTFVGSLLDAMCVMYPWEALPPFHLGYASPRRSHRSRQPYHNELVGLRDTRAMPDYIILGCLRDSGDPGQIIKVLDSTDILKFVPEEDLRTLRQSRFIVPNTSKAFNWTRTPQPIISELNDRGHRRRCILRGGRATVPHRQDDAAAWRALDSLQHAIFWADFIGCAHEIHLKPGDILVLKNLEVLHSQVIPDGASSVLMRSFWKRKDTSCRIDDGNKVGWTSGVAPET